MYGYVGRLLHVDLSRGIIDSQPLDPSVARKFVGGVGYATCLLYRDLDPQVDPLAPENPLIFMTGPLTGTTYPTASRYQV